MTEYADLLRFIGVIYMGAMCVLIGYLIGREDGKRDAQERQKQQP